MREAWDARPPERCICRRLLPERHISFYPSHVYTVTCAEHETFTSLSDFMHIAWELGHGGM
eukprot:1415312-Prymnesium_polylepis.1